ncbi:THUMP domain-containing protein 1 homolog [Lepeophtheirus salmonis]|uniref:THUMP domain-containing protein 1 homolog n=1 Tax=Lepeophtheirus salmonis TaxID=72036 RepID=UPI003AF3E9B7
MFVKSLLDPLPIATRIIESIQKDGQQRTRYLIRLIPIHTTCKAFSGSIQASVGELIGKLNLKALSLTYCVVFKTRYNNNLTQIEALKAVNEAVKKETDGKWTIKLKESDYAIVLEVITSYCCIGILPKYFQLKKYNLIELAKASQQTSLEKMEDDNKSSIAIGKTIEATNESPIKTEKTRNETINNDSDVLSLKEKEETFSQEKGREILEEDETKIESVVESAL